MKGEKNKNMDSITFNGIDYPAQTIELVDFGFQMISVESLENVLIDDNGYFTSKHAMHVDSQIFFYVPDDIIGDIEKIKTYVNENI